MFFTRDEDEAREVLGMVFEALGEDLRAVSLGGIGARDGRACLVATLHHCMDATGGIVGRDGLHLLIWGQEKLGLCLSNRVRVLPAEVFHVIARAAGHAVVG